MGSCLPSLKLLALWHNFPVYGQICALCCTFLDQQNIFLEPEASFPLFVAASTVVKLLGLWTLPHYNIIFQSMQALSRRVPCPFFPFFPLPCRLINCVGTKCLVCCVFKCTVNASSNCLKIASEGLSLNSFKTSQF